MSKVTSKLPPLPLTRTLKAGKRGDDVLAVRRALAEAGLLPQPKRRTAVRKVPAWRKWHRNYGPAMVNAVKKFQKQHKLRADGKYGPNTHAKLKPNFDQYGSLLLRHYYQQAHRPKPESAGVDLIWIDGRQVAAGVGNEVLRIRKAGRWKGTIVSGYRDPAYSEQLCMNMCGQPRCPGMCAGTSSNHGRKGGREGAVDLTDFWVFADECRRLDSWLTNILPNDRVHFSQSGQ